MALIVTGWSVAGAVERGLVPFLIGDRIEAVAAGLLLPGAWRLLDDAWPWAGYVATPAHCG